MRPTGLGSEEGRGGGVLSDRDGWGPDSMRPDRKSMRPDHGFAVPGGYLATCALLGGLMGAVLGGVIGSSLGSWLGERAGDDAQAAGRVCQTGFFDLIEVVDCGDMYASGYALRFGLAGVLVGLIFGLAVGLDVGPRLGRRIVRNAGKPQREATSFMQVPRPTPSASGTRQDAAGDIDRQRRSVQGRSVLASEGARSPGGEERTLTRRG